jgi:DNA modification methylase
VPLVKSYLLLKNEQRSLLPSEFQADDVRYAESLVECFLREYTREGDRVFDPFAGFGTTLLVAQEMGRVPFGIEYDRARCDYVRSRLKNPDQILHGDARQLSSYSLPTFDFSMTSPPYMARDEQEDPLTAYTAAGHGYARYLECIREIYRQLAVVLREDARVVIEVSNLKGRQVTTLAWDIAREVARELTFEGEVVVGWEETYGYGYDHSYCLIFRRGSPEWYASP